LLSRDVMPAGPALRATLDRGSPKAATVIAASLRNE
jgi:hypothetical protein